MAVFDTEFINIQNDFDFSFESSKTEFESSFAQEHESSFAHMIGTGTTDHNILINRNIPDQHNIGSISELQENLDNRVTKSFLTNMEIDDLFNIGIGG